MKTLILVLAIAAVATANDRIVNGADTEITSFPWQVSLQKLQSHFCGGSVISERYVISAAHCTQSVFTTSRVVAGITKLSDRDIVGTVKSIKSWTPHPNYNSTTIDYDYSIIKIESDFDLSTSSIKAVPLAGKNQDFSGDGITTGWGLDAKPGGEIPDTLQVAEIPLVGKTLCSKTWSGLTDRMLCAGGNGKTSCNGDSGGPLVYHSGSGTDATDYTLIGCVSYGTALCNVNTVAVYSRVAAVRDWIDTSTTS